MRYTRLKALRCALLTLPLSLAALPAQPEARQIVTDATGRSLELPAQPSRVFAAGPLASTLLYTLKPEAMIGWVRAPKPEDLAYLLPQVAALPELGRLTGRGDTLNLEVLLAAQPDLILDYGVVNDTYSDLAARVQEQIDVPYLLLDASFAHMPEGLRQAGAILAVPERAEALASYAEATLAGIDALLARVPQAGRPRVYLARGPEGLETAPGGAMNAEIIERAGGRNVVEASAAGLVTVSPEQLQAWAPEIILTMDKDFAANVAAMPEWQGIPAVMNGRVYLAPAAPFGFIDAPPSVNRLIGLRWLAHQFFPDRAEGDLHQEIIEFYQLFYGVSLDEAAVRALLGA